ncbi:DUF1836 domain-containing protein [Niallia oryzisoli]|uniref:DUF1836 domain-containing protein n=1 Tax=Niallia oryzisoli TaxID=1737571 RepID=A0ABZ2CCD0_9BACI
MENIKHLIDQLGLENHIILEDIPNIDLYMDQVIQLFESKYNSTKRDPGVKVLTKTMINNYAKGKLLFPIKNKKYSKEHLILISLIYQLKGVLSINDIKSTLDGINKKVEEGDMDLDYFYSSYLDLSQKNAQQFKDDIQLKAVEASDKVKKMEDNDADYLEKVLLISSLVNISNLYKRAAERLVDQIVHEKKDD